jgi:citrate lyase beta subunit
MSWPGSASKSSTVAPTSSSSSDSLDEDAPQELLLDEDDDSDDDEAPHFEALSSPVSGVVSVDELAELAPHLEAVSVSASASLAAVPSSRGPCPLERSAELRSALLAFFEALRASPASLAPHFDSVSVLASVVLSVLIVRNRRRHARRAG